MFITTILRFKLHPSSSLQARALTTTTRSTPSPPLLSSVQVTSVVSRSHGELLLLESSRRQFPIWSRPYSLTAMSFPLLLCSPSQL
ncbi:hypothetical protein F2Q70_00042411 [Brassica cretica]|uniref:Uncharacterized protein n=3 Tax=Brassica TaxID=3705 RepID=A0A8S9KHC5_BRACR|nr:hypothetical protein F2Q70_00042411 [Brassica cretica]KAF3515956.1 hypothetical protein DY000_02058696 [Brassica cretica]KAF3526056.1 hypothetical protein F2Q69_00046170 [Brassica cretica]KAG2250255.1 hypothetical protein Bca52824_080391 [Brassica carinata]